MNTLTHRLAAAAAGTVLSALALAASPSLSAGTAARISVQTPQTATPKREAHVEKRAERQQKRIAAGVASGRLTPKETARLEHKEAKVDKDIAKAEADGKITGKEAVKLEKEQNRTSRKIRRQKHDAQHK